MRSSLNITAKQLFNRPYPSPKTVNNNVADVLVKFLNAFMAAREASPTLKSTSVDPTHSTSSDHHGQQIKATPRIKITLRLRPQPPTPLVSEEQTDIPSAESCSLARSSTSNELLSTGEPSYDLIESTSKLVNISTGGLSSRQDSATERREPDIPKVKRPRLKWTSGHQPLGIRPGTPIQIDPRVRKHKPKPKQKKNSSELCTKPGKSEEVRKVEKWENMLEKTIKERREEVAGLEKSTLLLFETFAKKEASFKTLAAAAQEEQQKVKKELDKTALELRKRIRDRMHRLRWIDLREKELRKLKYKYRVIELNWEIPRMAKRMSRIETVDDVPVNWLDELD